MRRDAGGGEGGGGSKLGEPAADKVFLKED